MIIKNSNRVSGKFYNLALFSLFLVALFLRFLYLPQKAISFAYDQARDAFIVQEMLHGHLKILGPPVSGVPGLYHGVLYYYVIAPAYYFGHGDPVFVAYFLSTVSALGVFVIYFLTKLISKSKMAGILAALVFAFSFELTQYSNLMTNASMGVWFVPILYLGLYLWITKPSNWAPLFTGMGLGLAIQSEVALAYHLFPIVLWLTIFRKNISKKHLAIFVLFLTLSVLPMILSEIKFGFTGIRGVIYLLNGSDAISNSKNLSDYFITLIDQSGKTFANTLFPISNVFGGLLGVIMISVSMLLNKENIKKYILTPETFLTSWIFAYSLALPFGGWNMKHLLVGAAPAIAIYFAIFTWKNLVKYRLVVWIILIMLVGSNVYKIVSENKNGQTLFPLQPDLVLSNELKLVDFSYKNANNQPFSISSLTSPLFVNTLWSYVYNWYGSEKYGYLPTWFGRDQIGQLGNNLTKFDGKNSKHYFIIEPTYGIPELWVNYAIGDQNSLSQYVSEIKYGDLKIQERVIKNAYKSMK